MDEDEMTFDELRAVMLSGQEAMINPGPPPIARRSLEPTAAVEAALDVHIISSTVGATFGPYSLGVSYMPRPARLAVRRPVSLSSVVTAR